MSSEHTAGPWYHDPFIDDVVRDIANNRPIADPYVGDENIPVREQDANAALIAAAPEMLEALKEIRKASLSDYRAGVQTGLMCSAVAVAIEAINKAENNQ